MTRGGQTKTRELPERRCIVTGESEFKSGLIRFVVGPDNAIVPDLAEKLPGRGMWVSASGAAIATAIQKRLFARAAKQEAKVRDDLAEFLNVALTARLIELISLSRKAGVAICGLEKVKASLEEGSARLLIQANDGSIREKSRLRPPEGPESHIECLNSVELGLAFGRDSVIHAALKAGGISDRVAYEATRLTGLRTH